VVALCSASEELRARWSDSVEIGSRRACTPCALEPVDGTAVAAIGRCKGGGLAMVD
jgi:hypothetical protein